MKNPDRLYELLPVVYRQRDADQGYPLQALLRVITEQVDVVEDDMRQLYDNWFIETCDEWAVPYIGDLIGYQLLNNAGEPEDVTTPAEQQREGILIPRRDVANTIRARRRKGTLALLEELALDVADWPARAVEFYKLLGWTQNLHTPHLNRPLYHTVRPGDTVAAVARTHHLHVEQLLWFNPSITPDMVLVVGTRLLVGWRSARGQIVDLRDGDALDLIDGPFDRLAHTVDARRINSQRTPGRYNIPSVGVFVWRLGSYSVTQTHADCLDKAPHCYTFSVLGNNTPLHTRPVSESTATDIAGPLNVPAPIRRRAFARDKAAYYGAGKSLQIWDGSLETPVPLEEIVVADLSHWHYRPTGKKVAVDPVLGRIAFPQGRSLKKHVWVSYQYGFSADIGGGEYDRNLSQPAGAVVIRVANHDDLKRAFAPWQQDETPPQTQPKDAVIEIANSAVYSLPLNLMLQAGHTLQVRAANRCRPVIRLLNRKTDLLDALNVSGARGSRVTLDGLLITGRGVMVSGPEASSKEAGTVDRGDLCDVTIRHCTLVPGWSLDCDCKPCEGEEPSLNLYNTAAHIKIEHSILGSIEVEAHETVTDPVCVSISDSIWDATSKETAALSDDDGRIAYTRLTIARTTVFGDVRAHEIALAENCIFNGLVSVARRQKGCVRFCYVPPGSRTPARYECQPDLVVKAVQDKLARNEITQEESAADTASEQLRVEPEFNSTRYGTPTYCQLANVCADEIKTGADDESEMGAFHDLYQPQRAANLLTRLDEYTPAGMDAGIIYAT